MQRITKENLVKAAKVSKTILRTGHLPEGMTEAQFKMQKPLYLSVDQVPTYNATIENHERIKPHILSLLRTKRQKLIEKTRNLTTKFNDLAEAWKRKSKRSQVVFFFFFFFS